MFVQARKTEELSKAKDPKKAITEAVGDLSGIDIFNNLILVGTYIRPEKSGGGIFIPQTSLKEDEYQSKCGLILKRGPLAFEDEAFEGQDADVGSWIVYRVNDGWPVHINGVACRVIQDVQVRLKLATPDLVF